jgi:hypothetical protein
MISITIATQRLSATNWAALDIAHNGVILTGTCSAVMTQLSAQCTPIFSLVAISDPRLLNPTLENRGYGLSCLQSLDVLRSHLDAVVNLETRSHDLECLKPNDERSPNDQNPKHQPTAL